MIMYCFSAGTMKITTKAVLDMETLEWVSKESYEYIGPVDLCCGPTSGETQAATAQNIFANTLQQDTNSRFAGQTASINQINSILQGVEAGKFLPGYSSATLAALNTGALDTTAANYKNAMIAAQNANAGRGGDTGLQPGTVSQEAATIASNAAGQLSSEQQQIALANQQQAVENTKLALGGFGTEAQLQSPDQLASETNRGLAQSFADQNTIAQQQAQEQADIAGGIAGLVTTPLTGGTSLLGFASKGLQGLTGGGAASVDNSLVNAEGNSNVWGSS
jgi:hypothetical protein